MLEISVINFSSQIYEENKEDNVNNNFYLNTIS